MCAVMLKHNPPPTRGFFAWFNRQVDHVTQLFGDAVTFTIKRMVVALVLLAAFLYAIWHLFHIIPTSFVPNEDQGYAMAAIIMPQAASLSRTQAIADKADAIFRDLPGVATRTVVTGYSLLDSGFKTNAGTIFVTFTDFDSRYKDVDTAKAQNARAILQGFYAKASQIEGAIVVPIAPPAIPGIGTTGGFEFWIQDTGTGDPVALDGVMQDFLKKARERPELTGLATTYTAATQQLRADVDRDRAQLLGVPIQDVYSAIQAQFGSLAVSQYNLYSNVWWVVVQSDAPFRQNPEDLTRLYTRNNQNQMVPLSALVTTKWTSGPDILPHFNGFPAAKINGNAAAGYSSGQAIATMEEVAKDVLPPGYQFAWSGLAFQEKQSGGTSGLAFVFGLIIVFLVLAAQYESWTLPGAVMTAVPFGILGALLTNHLRGLENDVYFQIGLLVLIGLGAKNAVLRVSAAVEFRKQGKSIMEATILAGEQRLRPIIMTSLAFAIGCLPLALAVGAGANARHSIGTGIIGGMLGETTLAMLYVPLFFYIFDRLKERGEEKKNKAAQSADESLPPPRRKRHPRRARKATDDAPHRCSARDRRAPGGLHGRARLHAPARRRTGGVHLRAQGRRRHREHAVVEAVRRSGARPAHRGGARAQPQREGGRRQRRAGRGLPDADPLAALSAGGLRRERAAGALVGVECNTRVVAPPAESADAPTRRCCRCPGSSTSGAASAACPRVRARACSPPTRRAAAWCCRWSPPWRATTSRCGDWTSSSSSPADARTYAESLRLFELQFKYGQISQMNVAQVQSQYGRASRPREDPGDREPDRADAERAVGARGTQSRRHPARQEHLPAGTAEGTFRACPPRSSSGGPT